MAHITKSYPNTGINTMQILDGTRVTFEFPQYHKFVNLYRSALKFMLEPSLPVHTVIKSVYLFSSSGQYLVVLNNINPLEDGEFKSHYDDKKGLVIYEVPLSSFKHPMFDVDHCVDNDKSWHIQLVLNTLGDGHHKIQNMALEFATM
jgi:hypothetical protein